ncbi:HNH endonuclease signature motif containing protein [Burkholderia ubonensis]|uniref:HNH endonuclease signature motif containing protein n=1 Tax=Burkholderia ubonensis TaxID=101571 RepID=UPI0012F9D1DF|nr:HNH endonuclease signature motif containing protein [Burkholderia ubonensis]
MKIRQTPEVRNNIACFNLILNFAQINLSTHMKTTSTLQTSNATFHYLVGIGCDTRVAANLSARYSVEELRNFGPLKLKQFGLPESVVSSLKKRRLPVPEKTLRQVLASNLELCCVCRKRGLGVVVHHIEKYSISKNHDISNLAVLCTAHHSKAHASFELEQNLTSERIINYKRKWEEACISIERWILVSAVERISEVHWDWVNFRRVLQSTLELSDFPTGLAREKLTELGILNEQGHFVDESWQAPRQHGGYFVSGDKQIYLAAYITQVIELLARNRAVLDITPYLDEPELLIELVTNGDFITVKADFYYSPAEQFERNDDSAMIARAQTRDVLVEFPYDPWFCLSSTSRLIHYHRDTSTRQVLFGMVRSIKREQFRTHVLISPIGTSPTFDPRDRLLGGYFPVTAADRRFHLKS